MPPGTASPTDQMLYELVNGSAPATIAEVIDRMQAIDSLLPPNDGLKWFNQLYLIVTRQVATEPPQGAWQSPVWITRLDVVFAGLYFGAIRDFVAGRAVPSAWAALFGARYHAGVDRIQFALAGMNAHINHDLALALLSTDDELHVVPGPGDPEFADYQSVNDLLNSAMPAALAMLAADALGMIAQDTGKIGRLLAFWDIRSARELAWEFADHLRSLANSARDCALNAQGALTGALSRAILSAV